MILYFNIHSSKYKVSILFGDGVVEPVLPVVIDDCCVLVEVAVLGGEVLIGVVEAVILEDVEVLPVIVLLLGLVDIIDDDGEDAESVEKLVDGEVADMVEPDVVVVEVVGPVMMVTVDVLPMVVKGSVTGEVEGFVVDDG